MTWITLSSAVKTSARSVISHGSPRRVSSRSSGRTAQAIDGRSWVFTRAGISPPSAPRASSPKSARCASCPTGGSSSAPSIRSSAMTGHSPISTPRNPTSSTRSSTGTRKTNPRSRSSRSRRISTNRARCACMRASCMSRIAKRSSDYATSTTMGTSRRTSSSRMGGKDGTTTSSCSGFCLTRASCTRPSLPRWRRPRGRGCRTTPGPTGRCGAGSSRSTSNPKPRSSSPVGSAPPTGSVFRPTAHWSTSTIRAPGCPPPRSRRSSRVASMGITTMPTSSRCSKNDSPRAGTRASTRTAHARHPRCGCRRTRW